jgi:hypothetical protein
MTAPSPIKDWSKKFIALLLAHAKGDSETVKKILDSLVEEFLKEATS